MISKRRQLLFCTSVSLLVGGCVEKEQAEPTYSAELVEVIWHLDNLEFLATGLI
ncbi:MAG: hypothetical protein HQ492_11865 [Woeseiaceae bacterium]|nr:hypothetical protein [Woeseiaceae bacterium]